MLRLNVFTNGELVATSSNPDGSPRRFQGVATAWQWLQSGGGNLPHVSPSTTDKHTAELVDGADSVIAVFELVVRQLRVVDRLTHCDEVLSDVAKESSTAWIRRPHRSVA
jgi:hypothetical protein